MKKICSIIVLILCAATLFAGIVPRLWPPLLKKAVKKEAGPTSNLPAWLPQKSYCVIAMDMSTNALGWVDLSTNANHANPPTGWTDPVQQTGSGSVYAQFVNANLDGLALDYISAYAITSQISFAYWLRVDVSGNFDMVINHVSSAAWADGWGSYLGTASGGQLYTFVENYAANRPFDTGVGNGWNHWIMTFDGTTVSLYRDGVLVDTDNYSGTITSPTTDINIGCQTSSHNYDIDAGIDELYVWSTALTSNEAHTVFVNETQPD